MDWLNVILGWFLGISGSLIVFYFQKRHEQINKIRNMVSVFEALREDWNDFKNIDNLDRLKFRQNNFLASLDKVSEIFIGMEDKKATSLYLNLKRYLSEFHQSADAGFRGQFHFSIDKVDQLFNDQYFSELHDSYCRCNKKLHNLNI